MNKDLALHEILKIAITVLIVVVLIICAFRVGFVCYDFGYRVFTESAIDEKGSGTESTVEVTPDMSSMDIAEVLEDKGLVRNARLFWLQLQLSAYRNRIQNGTFTLSTEMTPKEMIQVMACDTDDAQETTEQ